MAMVTIAASCTASCVQLAVRALYAAAVVAVQLLQLLASAIDTVVQQLYSCYS